MSEIIEGRCFNRILDWDVSNMAREIRYIYYDFVVMFWGEERASRIRFNECNVQYMLDEINKVLKIIYEEKSPFVEFDDFFNGVVKLDKEKIESCSSKYISDVLINEYRYWCLPDGDFSWLSKDNERAVDFTWAFIASLTKHDLFLMLDGQVPLTRYLINNYPKVRDVYEKDVVPYRLMGGDYDLNNTSLKYDSILLFLDFLGYFRKELDYDRTINSERKANVISRIKGLWFCSIGDDSMIRWVSKNKDYLSWAWQYYLKTMEDGLVPYWFFSKCEKHYAKLLVLAYDLLSVDYSSKKLFMARLAKACAQEKYRENLSIKKQVSFSIRADVKDKLDELAEEQGKKLYELIEQLIEKEYESYKVR